MSANVNSAGFGTTASGAGSNATILLVARVLLAGVFVVFGIRKLLATSASVAYFTKLGVPAADILVWAVILIEVGGGLLLMIGWRTRLMAWLLAAFVVLATLIAHRYWEFDAPQYVQQLNSFMKNLAIVGGLLLVAACGPGRLSADRG